MHDTKAKDGQKGRPHPQLDEREKGDRQAGKNCANMGTKFSRNESVPQSTG